MVTAHLGNAYCERVALWLSRLNYRDPAPPQQRSANERLRDLIPIAERFREVEVRRHRYQPTALPHNRGSQLLNDLRKAQEGKASLLPFRFKFISQYIALSATEKWLNFQFLGGGDSASQYQVGPFA